MIGVRSNEGVVCTVKADGFTRAPARQRQRASERRRGAAAGAGQRVAIMIAEPCGCLRTLSSTTIHIVQCHW